MCEANALLKKRYGTVGQVVATLLSNVLSKAFSGAQDHQFHLAQRAAYVGRNEEDSCHVFPNCRKKSRKSSINKNVNNEI